MESVSPLFVVRDVDGSCSVICERRELNDANNNNDDEACSLRDDDVS